MFIQYSVILSDEQALDKVKALDGLPTFLSLLTAFVFIIIKPMHAKIVFQQNVPFYIIYFNISVLLV